MPGHDRIVVGLVLLVPPIRRWAMRRMTRGFDSFAWVDRMPGFPSSGTVVQGTVVTVEDSTFSDLPDIPRLSDSSEGDNSRKDDPQPPTTVGTRTRLGAFQGFLGRLTPRGGRSGVRPLPTCIFLAFTCGNPGAVSSVQAATDHTGKMDRLGEVAMGETSMKGTRIGTLSLERDDHVQPAERRVVRYVLPRGSRVKRALFRGC